MTIYAGGTAEFGALPCDYHHGAENTYSEIFYWFPGEASDALGRIHLEVRPTLLDRSTAAHTIDVAPAAEFIERAHPVQPLFRYLGIEVSRTVTPDCIYTHLTVPSPAQYNQRLQSLPLAPEHRPPQLALYPEKLFPAEAFIQELAANGRLLVSESQPMGIHDILAHAATTWLFLRPEDIARLQELGRAAQTAGPEAVSALMGHIDQTLASLAGLGGAILTALAYEGGAFGPVTQAGIELHWLGVTAYLGLALQYPHMSRGKALRLGLSMREHCYRLNAAAEQALAAHDSDLT